MGKQYWKPGNMMYPLPAVMVSCQRPEEKPNIITVAWSGTINTNLPMLYISVSIFSRIFFICTVTVAISPIDSISQISLNSSSFAYT